MFTHKLGMYRAACEHHSAALKPDVTSKLAYTFAVGYNAVPQKQTALNSSKHLVFRQQTPVTFIWPNATLQTCTEITHSGSTSSQSLSRVMSTIAI